jgi:hypothetical protein
MTPYRQLIINDLDSILKISPDPSLPKRGKTLFPVFTKRRGLFPPFGKGRLGGIL